MPPVGRAINGTSTLHEMCASGDYNTIRRMVEDSKKAQARQMKKQPGPSRTWEKLEGNVNEKDSTGRTPLHYAIEGGHEDVVRYDVQHRVGLSSFLRFRANNCIARVALSYIVYRLCLTEYDFSQVSD